VDCEGPPLAAYPSMYFAVPSAIVDASPEPAGVGLFDLCPELFRGDHHSCSPRRVRRARLSGAPIRRLTADHFNAVGTHPGVPVSASPGGAAWGCAAAPPLPDVSFDEPDGAGVEADTVLAVVVTPVDDDCEVEGVAECERVRLGWLDDADGGHGVLLTVALVELLDGRT
jgi:hypothetical protein